MSTKNLPGETQVAKTTSRIRLSDSGISPPIDADNLVPELSRYGLTTNSARIYLFLLGRRPVSSRIISKQLGLHRVDVYRKLKELQNLGIVDVHFGSPKHYEATPPSIALGLLLDRLDNKVDTLHNRGKYLRTILQSVQRLQETNPPFIEAGSESLYKVVTGREKYFKEISRVVHNARFEVLRIVSSGALIRTFLPQGLYKEYVQARNRDVSVKMIAQVDTRNLQYARRLARILSLRQIENAHLRFTVVDRTITILSARFDDEDMSYKGPRAEENYLFVSDTKFAEIACFFFEHIWALSGKLGVTSKIPKR